MFGLKTPIFQQFLKPFPEQTIWVSFTATKTELLWLQTMYFCVHFLLLYILANDKTPKLRVNKKRHSNRVIHVRILFLYLIYFLSHTLWQKQKACTDDADIYTLFRTVSLSAWLSMISSFPNHKFLKRNRNSWLRT